MQTVVSSLADLTTRPALNIGDYGAKRDGVTDDTAAWQRVFDLIKAAGGGKIIHPGGTSVLASATNGTGGLYYSLSLEASNVEIEFHGDAEILTTYTSQPSNYRPLIVFGSTKSYAVSSWASKLGTQATVYPISGSVAKGDRSVTLATAGNAANFTAGDICMLRTGQTISGTDQPDAELLGVVSANAGTGVVVFDRVTNKPYAQEYFPNSSQNTATSTSSTSWPASYGLAKVTDRVLRNIRFRGLKMRGASVLQMLSLWGLMDVDLDGTDLTFGYNGIGSRETARVRIRNSRLHHTGENNTVPYYLGPSTVCSEWDIDGLQARSDTAALLHAHEGVAGLRVRNFDVQNNDHNLGQTDVISVVGRGYDLVYDGGRIVCQSSSAAGGAAISFDQTMVADQGCGGSISNIAFVLNGMTNAIRDDGGTLRLGAGLSYTGAINRVSLRGFQRATPRGHEVMPRVLTGVVSYDKPSLQLGTFPQQAVVTAVLIQAETAGNAGSTNTVSVGWSGTATALANAVDVSSLGVTNVVPGHAKAGAQIGLSQAGAGRSLLAAYSQSGGAATAGRFIVTVFWHIAGRVD